jgi:hypothetical protein
MLAGGEGSGVLTSIALERSKCTGSWLGRLNDWRWSTLGKVFVTGGSLSEESECKDEETEDLENEHFFSNGRESIPFMQLCESYATSY